MPQHLPPGNRAQRQPQSRHRDAMCNAGDEPNDRGAADGPPADEQPADGDDARRADGLPAGEGGARREVVGHDRACSARSSRSGSRHLPGWEATQDQPATPMQARPASWHLKIYEPSSVLLRILDCNETLIAPRTFGSTFGTRAAGHQPTRAGARDRSLAPHSRVLQLSGIVMVAGRLKGAPPSETGPTGLGSRAIFLRITRDGRLPACLAGMEEVTSGAIALCSESIFAISVEIWPDIFFTS